MATFAYSADQHFLTVGGFPIQGFQDGSEITIEYESEQATSQVDIDGRNVVFNRTNDRRATVTFTLNEGSAANDFLSGIFQEWQTGQGGILPLFFKDNNGRSIANSDACTVRSVPSLGGGRESTGREWVLQTGQMNMFVGGAGAAI